MSSSSGQAEGSPAASAGPDADSSEPGKQAAGGSEPGGPERERGNGFAAAALALGAAGVTLVTIPFGVTFGVLGLRRAAQRGSGRVRAWCGLGLCLLWTATGAYLLPHLIRAADPGCTVYKGRALTAYNKVISDFSGSHAAPHLAADVSRAVSTLQVAVSRSRDPATARALSALARDLRTVLSDIHSGAVVPARAMTALNRDAARTDTACGTLHL